MKKTALFLGLASVFFTQILGAQNAGTSKKNNAKATKAPVAKLESKEVPPSNPVVFSVGNEQILKDEFMRQLNKNRKDKNKPSEAEIREYLNLYVNFKLKVKEAITMQLDTNPAFNSELAGYRKQLAAPYLNDKKVTEALMQEAFERMNQEINASHILINVDPNASPTDTLIAYNKALDLRKRIVKGERFDSLASRFSEDPSARKNFGKLGWFTVFQMVYPFECTAYKTPKGEISMPFRTQFGYHILKVNETRPARGEVKVQHIMIRTGYGAAQEVLTNAKERIDLAYEELTKGVPFDSLVERYSQDDGSKGNNGTMNWMSSLSGYPDEFKDICFALKPGEYSKPFSTDYGWHLVKFVEFRPIGEFKDLQDLIKNKVTRDSRSEGSKTAVIERVKKENNYKEFPVNFKLFVNYLDSSFLTGTWKFAEGNITNRALFSIGNKVYTESDFASYVVANQQPREKDNIFMAARNLFTSWANDKCLAYEESILETKYPEFNYVMTEYHDGILLFDLTDRKVWSKALNDTLGLEAFHAQTKSKYMWKERLSYQVYNCLDPKVKAAAIKMLKAGKSESEVLAKLNKKISNSVVVKDLKAEKTDPAASKLWDVKGVSDIIEEGSNKFYWVTGVIPAEPKTLKEAKGIVTSDYQDYLMAEWVKELRSKYPVTINEAIILELTK